MLKVWAGSGLLALLLLAGCDQGSSPAGGTPSSADRLDNENEQQWHTLSGELLYREKMALPKGATVTVALQDVSLQDVPSRVIAEQELGSNQQVPIPFTLRYEQADLGDGVSFAVSGQIRDQDGQLLWINTERHTVKLTEEPRDEFVTLTLHRVAEPSFSETDSNRPGPWDQAREDGANFWAVGNEPGWNLAIYPQRELVLVTGYGSHTDRVDDPGAQVEGDHLHYHSESEELVLTVDIYKEACQDNMSGEEFAYTVRLVRNEQELTGCGRDL